MANDPQTQAHIDWLGYVQPVGLVVSIPALSAAQCYINQNVIPAHQRFLSCLATDKLGLPISEISDLQEFTTFVLGWRADDLAPFDQSSADHSPLEVILPEFHEAMRPTHVVRECESADPTHPWLMLVQSFPSGTDLDKIGTSDDRNWQATPQAKFERLLRETQVPIGLLTNGSSIRLVYAPRGETSGYATFSVKDMVSVAGRPIFAALHMLLCEERLFSLPDKQRLPAILSESRKYQNQVSTKLSEQVLSSLYELVRGFQAADEQVQRGLLRDVLAENPNHVYAGLLTVLMRLVFILYAEDRGLISTDSVYTSHYSVSALFDRLRTDNGRFPDTMHQRYGSWAQLLTLFRIIHEGGSHGAFNVPPRHGYLFDPDKYNFLEGRQWKISREEAQSTAQIPHMSDGVVYNVLSSLLILDGERLSYRTLDVEQIGSVYETMMGFNLEVAAGQSIALKPTKPHGAPTCVNLDALLVTKSDNRAAWLKAEAEQNMTGQPLLLLKAATTIDELLAALDKRIAKAATPALVPKGAMLLQPSDERRRSGSHYTPRSLTQPIVQTTLKPVLEQLGDRPTATQILALKVCDPAMGSGAFLVEACRQLGDELVSAWHVHNTGPSLPPDEDEVLYARRLIAQRCLYGVDKNPLAVDLAKLSLWLATLAKGHPFTFLDHTFKGGDSLVGLTSDQITRFNWLASPQRETISAVVADRIKIAADFRRKIMEARDETSYSDLHDLLERADESISVIRFIGDAIISAFFHGDTAKLREARRKELSDWMDLYLDNAGKQINYLLGHDAVRMLRTGLKPVIPFHWETEFPEVFSPRPIGKSKAGFDVMVGNPPFAGKNTIVSGNHDKYIDWLKIVHYAAHGNSDLVAHFFRRSFNLIRDLGCFGLIATNTIAQGDTRSTGLRWICTHGGEIYNARKRLRWPGRAAVIVSTVSVYKGEFGGTRILDGCAVDNITAYLFHQGGNESPSKILRNSDQSFIGSYLLGMEFTFSDNDSDGIPTPLSEMNRLIKINPRNAERIFPFMGWSEASTSPIHAHQRYAINFGEMTEAEAREWPELFAIIEAKVKPKRMIQNRESRKKYWWRYAETTPKLVQALSEVSHALLAGSQATTYIMFAKVESTKVFSTNVCVIPLLHAAMFPVLSSRIHEEWSLFHGSSFGDAPCYTASTCFETFPFPINYQNDARLVKIGDVYHSYRADIMIRNDEGLTMTYNRFHDPNAQSPDICELRDFHAAMDRAVLEAYGWSDLAMRAASRFLLDYEDDEAGEESKERSSRKKPWRYRWPDEFRDEVLSRLLALNQERAEEERLTMIAGQAPGTSGLRRRAKKTNATDESVASCHLFNLSDEELVK